MSCFARVAMVANAVLAFELVSAHDTWLIARPPTAKQRGALDAPYDGPPPLNNF